jgi:hypothetical protein
VLRDGGPTRPHLARRCRMGRQTRQGGWEAQDKGRASGAGCRITKAADANLAPRRARGINTTRMRSNLTSPKAPRSLFALRMWKLPRSRHVDSTCEKHRQEITRHATGRENYVAGGSPCLVTAPGPPACAYGRLFVRGAAAQGSAAMVHSWFGFGRPAALHG